MRIFFFFNFRPQHVGEHVHRTKQSRSSKQKWSRVTQNGVQHNHHLVFKPPLIFKSHPGIKTAVTFGAPDPKYGEIVHCVVIPREEVRNVLTEEDVIRFGLERMAPFKVPVKVFFAEHVPVTATGKVQRKMIAELFSGASEK
eukprot:TRINITY_DN111_c0_g1_i1.p2 TRINITY_DN111_c0_g1~~TRINITY_DN111_c0_g1_i1.p2  ORF type:complete len:142 (+),score=28.77 TRINITY_DN111_c0_g1_i1:1960-2385(+)